MLEVTIENTLEEAWKNVVNQEMQLSLLRFQADVYQIKLRLERLAAASPASSMYRCSVGLHDESGKIGNFRIDNVDGRIAVRRAFARATYCQKAPGGSYLLTNQTNSRAPLR